MCHVIADAVIDGRGGIGSQEVPQIVSAESTVPVIEAAPAVQTVVVAEECVETESPAAAIAEVAETAEATEAVEADAPAE
jgi:hypothetical protein